MAGAADYVRIAIGWRRSLLFPPSIREEEQFTIIGYAALVVTTGPLSCTCGREVAFFSPVEIRSEALQVLVRDNNIDQALRVLKKKMQREGVFREMKRRRFYEKPSEKTTGKRPRQAAGRGSLPASRQCATD